MSKEINLDDWKWLRKISANDSEAVEYYSELARKNEALMVETPTTYLINIYIPDEDTTT